MILYIAMALYINEIAGRERVTIFPLIHIIVSVSVI